MFYSKNTGETTSEFANRVSQLYGGVKTCACGKLDPMARGVTRVLIGNETKQMEKHLNSDKTYEFYLAIGISTDSDDIMGIIDNTSNNINAGHIYSIKKYMDTTVKNMSRQKFHHYSALRLRKNGQRQPLWYWHSKGLLSENEIPDKEVTVYSQEFLDIEVISFKDYLKKVFHNLDQVKQKDNFNIDRIKEKWQKLNFNKNLYLLKFKLKVSSGFYVRMIAKSMKKDLNIPVHVYDIHRTNVS